jgi:hypothetical protein
MHAMCQEKPIGLRIKKLTIPSRLFADLIIVRYFIKSSERKRAWNQFWWIFEAKEYKCYATGRIRHNIAELWNLMEIFYIFSADNKIDIQFGSLPIGRWQMTQLRPWQLRQLDNLDRWRNFDLDRRAYDAQCHFKNLLRLYADVTL